MNVLSNLVPFGGLLEKVFDRVFPNPEDKAKAQLEVLAMQQKGELAELAAITEGDKAQAEVNKVEAASESLFVSGWRPAVGWICAAALFAQAHLAIDRALFEVKADVRRQATVGPVDAIALEDHPALGEVGRRDGRSRLSRLGGDFLGNFDDVGHFCRP